MNRVNIFGKVILKHKEYPDSVLILKRPAYDFYEPIGDNWRQILKINDLKALKMAYKESVLKN
jgi:hypothetical protein